ncbi:hypothetical protein L1049_016348 [Liquidambar formosana]|uniref:SWIM-type domain-containing protein n=1 Tax=Liquidambar formosana TaxID=63359 RepID=A0AAP0X0H4_LIQFO
MAKGKLIVICQSGGKFTTTGDGSLSYSGGDAHAMSVNKNTKFDDFTSEIAEMGKHDLSSMTIKYFLPNNNRTLISISSNKDIQRMIEFHEDSATVDVYVVTTHSGAIDVPATTCSRSSRTTAPEPASPVAQNDLATLAEDIRQQELTNAEDIGQQGHIDAEDIGRPKLTASWKNSIVGLGQQFNSANEFRDALHKYSLAHGFIYTIKRACSTHVSAKCRVEGCPWIIGATKLSKTQLFRIKKMNGTHTCGVGTNAVRPRASKKLVASIVKEKLRNTPNYRPMEIVDEIRRDFGLEVRYAQAWRGMESAREELHGSFKEAFNQLPWLCEKIIETNPDRGRGISESLPQIFNNCYHGYCLDHLTENLKQELKGPFTREVVCAIVAEFHNAAYAPTVEGFKNCIETMTCLSPEAYEWIQQNKPEHWANAFFKGTRYNHLKSSTADSFYNWASEFPLPIVEMIETTRRKMMELIYKGRVDSDEWSSRLTPSSEEKLQKITTKLHSVEVLFTPGSAYKVRDSLGAINVVNLDSWDCSCREWQLTGLPCLHAVAVIDCIGKNVYDYCSKYFTTEAYRNSYSESINPVLTEDRPMHRESSPVRVHPPSIRRSSGRPKEKRVRSADTMGFGLIYIRTVANQGNPIGELKSSSLLWINCYNTNNIFASLASVR